MRARRPAMQFDDGPVTLRGNALKKALREACEGNRESGTQLLAAERETLPPEPIEIEQIHVGVSVDELLYRYDMGDIAGALSVGLPLLDEDYVPRLITSEVVLSSISMTSREEYALSLVDGWTTLAEVVEHSNMSTLDTLHALCQLIEKRVVGLG